MIDEVIIKQSKKAQIDLMNFANPPLIPGEKVIPPRAK